MANYGPRALAFGTISAAILLIGLAYFFYTHSPFAASEITAGTKLIVAALVVAGLVALGGRLRRTSVRVHELQELTRRLEAESRQRAAAEAEHRRLSAVLEGTTDLVIMTDNDLRAIYMNSAALQRLQIRGATLGSLDVGGLHVQSEGTPSLPEMLAIALQRGSWRGRNRIRTGSGNDLFCSEVIIPCRDENDRVVGYAAILRDLGEELRAQEQLELAYRDLRFHIDNTPMGVIELDRDIRISRWTGMAEKIFGWTEEEVLGQDLFEFGIVHKEDRERIREGLNNLRTMSMPELIVENRNNTKDGRTILCEWHNSVRVDANGKLISILSLAIDITDERARENELRTHTETLERLVVERTDRVRALEAQRSEMERFVATGRMAARIAHEINNPLGSIKNVATLLKDPLLPAADRNEWLSLLMREVDRIASVVRQMYLLYRPVDVEFMSTDLQSLLSDIRVAAQPRFEAKGVELVIASVPASETRVITAEKVLNQILSSLLDNALDASERGHTVTLGVTSEESHITIAVTDQGCGVAEEIRKQIFEPFFTTKRSDGSSATGFGLGLSVSRALAHSLGGELSFKPGVPGGATFFLTIPRDINSDVRGPQSLEGDAN